VVEGVGGEENAGLRGSRRDAESRNQAKKKENCRETGRHICGIESGSTAIIGPASSK
jgi:hypothetical protein